MAFFLLMAFQDTQNKEKKHYLCFTNWLIFLKRLFNNMKDPSYFTLKVGHVEFSNFKDSMTLRRVAIMLTVPQTTLMRFPTMKRNIFHR